jgi:hypothetical protein
VRTLRLGPAGATTVVFEIDSAEVQLSGIQGVQDVVVSYGYFVEETEVLDEDVMVPEFQLEDGCIVIRQTATHLAQSKAIGAKMRVTVTAPAVFQVRGQLAHSTLSIQNTGGAIVKLTSGTIDVKGCNGAVKLQVGSGTVHVAGLVRGYNHRVHVHVGTITLHADELLALVNAIVEQGMILGTFFGRLERRDSGGWHLYPARHEAGTMVECVVGSGTITLHGSTIL